MALTFEELVAQNVAEIAAGILPADGRRYDPNIDYDAMLIPGIATGAIAEIKRRMNADDHPPKTDGPLGEHH